jgi:tRNA nucleotidyltransferase (CCA-adding enzyme)
VGQLRLIIGHSNMDLDCLGSVALARRLFPGSHGVRSGLIHPVARNLYNLYGEHLDLITIEQVGKESVEQLVVVDTRSLGRIKEYLGGIHPLPAQIDVFDHHPRDSSDIPGAVIHEGSVGANTTLLGVEAMRRGIRLSPEEATIALTGIYADTGSFTHENVALADFEVAGYLVSQGASVTLVKSFLQTLKDEMQISLFHEILNRLTYQTLHGHQIVTTYMELGEQVGGLSAVVEKVFEVENPDAIFCVFYFTKEQDSLIIARSQQHRIDLARILAAFGGGGHSQASSALLKNEPGRRTFHALQAYLKAMLDEAATARSIMKDNVQVARDSWTLREASEFLEKIDRTGAPVVDGVGRLCGFLSLREISKGRSAGKMGAPVRAFMTRKVISAGPYTTLRELEHIFFSHTIFSLPIVEDGKVSGLVTREDYLKARMGEEGPPPISPASGAPATSPVPPAPAIPHAPAAQA